MPDNDSPQVPPASSLGLGSRALRNTTIVLTAKVIARLIALVTVLYMIRKLGQVQYGTFALLVNLTAIISVVLDLASTCSSCARERGSTARSNATCEM